MKIKYLILDLDGTIIETKSGNSFPNDINDWKFKRGVLEKIRDYYDKNYKLAIITNQGGIGLGFVCPYLFKSKLNSIIQRIQTFVLEEYRYSHSKRDDFRIEAYVADTMSHPGRKPNPCFAFKLREECGCDLPCSLYVGDASGLERRIKITEKDLIKSLENIVSKKRGIGNTEGVFSVFFENEKYDIHVRGSVYTSFKFKKDHSDSDLQFARNSGIPYMDIDDFLKPHEIK